jgi:hypothetical protein
MKRDKMQELMRENAQLRLEVDVWRRTCTTLSARMNVEPPPLAPAADPAGLLAVANEAMELLGLQRIEGEADALARIDALRAGPAPQEEWEAWKLAQAWLMLEMYLSSVTSAQA